MHDLVIENSETEGRPPRYFIKNCDKDGALVATRLASISGGVASSRPLTLNPDRYTDSTFFQDQTSKLASFYDFKEPSPLLDKNVVVLSSIHRTALYVAEALHAILLPLQVISFARDVTELVSTPVLSIAGSDFDYNGFWQWNKPTDLSHFSEKYINILREAENLVVIGSNDPSTDCPVIGKIGPVFINSTIRQLNPKLWSDIKKRVQILEGDIPHLSQWEWGLPQPTITAVKDLWKSLGKEPSRLKVIMDGTVELYRKVPILWEAYLNQNNVHPSGITLNGYWTAHPYFERAYGYIPIPFYHFESMRKTAAQYFERVQVKYRPKPEVYAFSNDVGGLNDSEQVWQWLCDYDLEQNSWFSCGLDCPGANCFNYRGNPIPNPSDIVSQKLMTAPFKDLYWKPLSVETVSKILTQSYTE